MSNTTKSNDSSTLPLTENRNPRTMAIDRLPTRELVQVFCREDRAVPDAVAAIAEDLARAVELAVSALQAGGRIVYLGAGTSGRLGVLDASECPPTFGVPPGMVVALIAGGSAAVQAAVEGAEDDGPAAKRDLGAIGLGANDFLVGVSASGITPYVRAGLVHGRSVGAKTALLSCNPYLDPPPIDVLLNPVVGPEVITGSTRLKAGTACKMVLNTLSSAAMIRIGKVYQNLMVDLMATNQKLRRRSLRIVEAAAGVPNYQAEALLADAGGEVKTAIVMGRLGLDAAAARAEIARHRGVLFRVFGEDADRPWRPEDAAVR